MKALDHALERIRRAPLDNLANLARETLGDPEVIPLWYGEGDLAAPAFIGKAMMAAVEAGHVFYTRQSGIPELCSALAGYLTGLNARAVAEDRITVTAGGMNAIMLAIQLVAGDGDNVIVIDPVWPNCAGMARLVGAEVRSVRLDYGPAGWGLDLGKLAAAMDERTAAVFFASPGNPTGAMIPIETQAAMLDLCRSRGVWLIADEVYGRFVFGRNCAPSLLDHADPEDRLFVINSFSKAWAMTGWRLGWLVHPPSLGPTLAMMTQYTTSGVTTFLQHAGVAAIQEGEDFVTFVRDYCQEGVGIVHDALAGLGGVRLGPRPSAGMYVFFELADMADSRAACLDILRRTKVGIAPGCFFGPASEGFLRICACRAPDQLRAAMARLEAGVGLNGRSRNRERSRELLGTRSGAIQKPNRTPPPCLPVHCASSSSPPRSLPRSAPRPARKTAPTRTTPPTHRPTPPTHRPMTPLWREIRPRAPPTHQPTPPTRRPTPPMRRPTAPTRPPTARLAVSRRASDTSGSFAPRTARHQAKTACRRAEKGERVSLFATPMRPRRCPKPGSIRTEP